MNIYTIVRSIIRFVICAKDNETINDALERIVINFKKHLYKKHYSSNMLKSALKDCGISNGDIIMVHCSWRNMYNYNGCPEDVINILKDLVGESGTILMPSYGANRYRFDVINTPSNAGVLSEVFRRQKDVQRSACTHFSVAGIGKYADAILSDHINSKYGFDKYSPCYKLGDYPTAKEVFLGLGSDPTKISVFHCAATYLCNCDEKMNKLLSHEYESELIINGIVKKMKMYIRLPGHENDNTAFKKIYRSLKERKSIKLSNLDIVVINIHEAIQHAIFYAKKGIYCYKGMNKL